MRAASHHAAQTTNHALPPDEVLYAFVDAKTGEWLAATNTAK